MNSRYQRLELYPFVEESVVCALKSNNELRIANSMLHLGLMKSMLVSWHIEARKRHHNFTHTCMHVSELLIIPKIKTSQA